MSPRRTLLMNGVWSLALGIAVGMSLLGSVARADDDGEKKRGGPPAHAQGRGGYHAGRTAAWKAQRVSGRNTQIIDAVGPPYVGRASMVINAAGTVSYTKVFLGLQASCDSDLRNAAEWQPNQAHALHENVVPLNTFGGNKFMATNAGTTGAVEPAWPPNFGDTVVDGTITWVNTTQNWAPGRAYTAGMVAEPSNISVYRLGSNFLATTSGTSGGTEPAWPTTAGATVNDNGIVWRAIGFYPGSFTGCSPMQLISRASGGAETVLAAEGDPIGANGEQLMGWSDFHAMNASGVVAFRAESAGFIRNDDESPSGIFTVGPGAGNLTKIAASSSTIGGRGACGFSSMTAINDAGQVLFDGYAREHQEIWQPNHVFPANQTYPTVPNGLVFVGGAGGTSGATEPVWPTSPGQTVADGTITWTGQVQDCDENDHGLIRFTSGPGNELLVAQGSAVGGSTVIGFGIDDNSQPTGTCGFSTCIYENIDGKMSASGHVPVVLNLLDGTQGVFDFTGPGASTQVARSGVAGVTAIGPHVSINDSDQVVYRANSGGVDHLFRFTPPSTTVTIVSVGDVVNGHTISTIGAFSDINNSGNVVYGALFNGDSASGFYYWDGANAEIVTGGFDPTTLASEMITLNNANQVCYVTGTTTDPDEADGAAEGHEDGGAFLWTKAGGATKFIAVGDIVSGNAVTNLYAQHPSFQKRQFSSAGCLATAYVIGTDDPELDCQEGDPASDCYGAGGPKLFVSCGAACPTITLSPPTLPGGSQNSPYSQQISASGGAPPYGFTETGALPAGMTFTSGGLLSGTPTVAGSFPITVTATDSNSCIGTQAYTLIIGSPTQVTIVINPPSRTVSVGSVSTLTVTINIPQPTDTIVTLTSSNPAIVSVPPTTTILANQTSATFQITAVSVGGPVTITAALPASFGAVPATASVTVVSGPIAGVPTLSGWMLALLAVMLAAIGLLLTKLR